MAEAGAEAGSWTDRSGSDRPRRFRDIAVASALAVALVLAWLPHVNVPGARRGGFLRGDCLYYQGAIVSMVVDGDLDMTNNIGRRSPLNRQLALGSDGRFVPKHNLLLPAASLPFWMLLGNEGLLLFNIVQLLGLMTVVFFLNRRCFGLATSALSTFLCGTTTLFYEYSYNYSPDIFSSLLLLGGLLLTTSGRYRCAAVLLGLSIFAKVSNGPLVAIVLAYACWGIATDDGRQDSQEAGTAWLSRVKTAATMGTAFAVSLLPMAAVNAWFFGAPWITGYQRAVRGKAPDGSFLFDNHLNDFHQPLLFGLWRLLFDPVKGIVVTNPILVAAVVGMLCFRAVPNRRLQLVSLVLIVVQLLFFAKYDDWATSHYSNRFLMTTVCLSTLGMSALVEALFSRLGRGRQEQPAG